MSETQAPPPDEVEDGGLRAIAASTAAEARGYLTAVTDALGLADRNGRVQLGLLGQVNVDEGIDVGQAGVLAAGHACSAVALVAAARVIRPITTWTVAGSSPASHSRIRRS
jgi:hypothetical protein